MLLATRMIASIINRRTSYLLFLLDLYMALVDRVHSHFAAGPQVRTSQPMAILRNTSYIRHACQRKLVDFIGLTVVRADRIISRAAQSHSSPVHHPDAVPSALDIDEGNIVTRFIAETLLPTKHGKFRLRGYKHSVRLKHSFNRMRENSCMGPFT